MSKDKIQLTEDEQNKLNKELMDSDHTPWVVSAIIKGADINTKGRSGKTALHVAADTNDLDNIIYFLEKGADINAKNYRGKTPFMLAMESKHAEAMKLLISKGYDATKEEKSKIFEIEHPTLNDKLFTALEKCDINEIDALIKQGADVNAKQNGEPFLSYAFHSMLPFEEHGLDAINRKRR
jgi:ankyrin repeat protein